MDYFNELMSQKEIFIKFMKEKYPLYYNSNIFLRDILYAIKSYFEKKDQRISYSEAERLAYSFVQKLEESKELIKISKNGWKVNFSFDKVVNTNEGVQNQL